MVEYKRCSKCKKEKVLSQFNKKGRGYNAWCRSCSNKNLRKHYRENKQYYIDKKNKLKRRTRERIWKIKQNGRCKKCGEDHPACLVFHHTDPSTKKFQIASNMARTISLNKLMVEIEKCEILCANCHLKFHNKRVGR